ncbi:MAG TPA: hypothetical protein VL426_05035 [Candidatus Binatia bacterium]|nr:hypothetical protein [Candidatus Binatia bacterium]
MPKKPFFALLAVVAAIVGVTGLIAWGLVTPMPVDEDGVYNAVRALGFDDAVITARYGGQTVAWQQGCGEGEMSACEVRATAANGRGISFLVCCGGAGGRTCSVRQPLVPR